MYQLKLAESGSTFTDTHDAQVRLDLPHLLVFLNIFPRSGHVRVQKLESFFANTSPLLLAGLDVLGQFLFFF